MAHFLPELAAHFHPELVAHFHPESMAHFEPESMAHFEPEYLPEFDVSMTGLFVDEISKVYINSNLKPLFRILKKKPFIYQMVN